MNTEGKVDLHCHTKASDNSLSIRDVMETAKRAGIGHLAITDHDTTAAIGEASKIGAELGISVIPGIEISAYDYARGRRAHILGYYIEPNHPALLNLCEPMVEQRHEASMRMVDKLRQAGYEITWDQVKKYAAGGTAVYKQHIMHALMDAGYCSELNGELQKKLFSRQGEGERPGTAYIPLRYVDAFDAIAAIREAGGIPVLAHPGQLGNFDAIPEWAERGLEGIEVRHPSHDARDEEKAEAFADRYGLAKTGGSDFHGEYGGSSYMPMGRIDAGMDSLTALKQRRTARGNPAGCPGGYEIALAEPLPK